MGRWRGRATGNRGPALEWALLAAVRILAQERTLRGFNAVGVVGKSDVWAVGRAISRWDGKSWVTAYTIAGRTVDPLAAVAAISAGDVWMVGATGFIHYSCPKAR